MRGALPAGGRKIGDFEIYDRRHYMTVTGQHLDGTPASIEDRRQEVEALYARFCGDGATSPTQCPEPDADQQPDADQRDVGEAGDGVEAVVQPADGAAPQANGMSDDELIAKALLSKNKQGRCKFKELWEGSWQDAGYKSPSEATLALCRQLAFWTRQDASRIDRLFRRSPLYSDKWERTDHRTRIISRAIDSASQVYSPPPPRDEHWRGEGGKRAAPAVAVDGYDVTDGGVYIVGEGGHRSRICSRLVVVAITRNAMGEDWGRLLKIWDRDGQTHLYGTSMQQLAGDGTELRAHLMSVGLEVSTSRGAHENLSTYLQSTRTDKRARCVPRVGWSGPCFVLPDVTIGPGDSEMVVFQTPAESEHHFRVSGTLEHWQEHVGRPCRGNPRLLFLVSVPFAAPLLGLVGEDGGGFHIRGDSSTGKTTGEHVAGSVCGGGHNGFVQTWRATANAIEGVA